MTRTPAKKPKAIGRPSSFTKPKADRICARLAAGESLRTICKSPGMPRMASVFRWLADEARADFREQYARAREAQAHNLFDEIIEISDTPMLGVEKKTDPDGTTITEGDMLGHRKLQIDARKWYLSKVLPKVYGDKLDLTHDGAIKVVQVTELTSAEERADAWKKP